MKNINVDNVSAHAKPGTNVRQCIVESIILGMEECRKVELIHNDKKFVISHEDIINNIIANGILIEF